MIRKILRRSLLVVAFATLASMSFSSAAYAYIDPGTGAMLLQLLLGGIAGSLVILKLYWHRLRAAMAQMFGQAPPPNSDPE